VAPATQRYTVATMTHPLARYVRTCHRVASSVQSSASESHTFASWTGNSLLSRRMDCSEHGEEVATAPRRREPGEDNMPT